MAPDGVDHIEALLEARVQVRQLLRAVLQVGVHEGYDLAQGRVDASRERDVLTEVARQAKGPHAAVLVVQLREDRPAAVRAAVIHEDQLVGLAHLAEHFRQPPMQLPKTRLLIEDGDDDGEGGRHAGRQNGTQAPRRQAPPSDAERVDGDRFKTKKTHFKS